MDDVILSQSTISRDPFEMAKQRAQAKGQILSNSPADLPAANPQQQGPIDINPMLQKLGIDSTNIANNEIGRVQLVSRLQAKFGDTYLQNPEAYSILTGFDQRLQQMGQESQQSMNLLLTQSKRTLNALLGG